MALLLPYYVDQAPISLRISLDFVPYPCAFLGTVGVDLSSASWENRVSGLYPIVANPVAAEDWM